MTGTQSAQISRGQNEQFASISSAFDRVCAFCAYYEKTARPIRSSALDGRQGIAALKKLRDLIEELLGSAQLEGLLVDFSKGQSNIPRVPWIAIAPRRQSVSIDPSVTLCFGRRGEGAVAGMMFPARRQLSEGQAVMRSRIGRRIAVDVDGVKPETKYNDRFANPREFLRGKTKGAMLLRHLRESIVLLHREMNGG